MVNEDAFISAPTTGRGDDGLVNRFWAVADGMGGHNGGREASQLACRVLQVLLERQPPDRGDLGPRALGRHLVDTVLRVDRLVRQRAASRRALAHMGTTLSCLLMADGHSIIAHVGDSRVYRRRRGYLTCLTTDHTFVQEMIFEGELDPAKAHTHPLRHLLTNAVGTAEALCYVEKRIDRVRAGDRFLLCSDGLTNVLDVETLSFIMASEKDAGGMAEDLVAAALERNTRDNVTAVVVHLLERGKKR